MTGEPIKMLWTPGTPYKKCHKSHAALNEKCCVNFNIWDSPSIEHSKFCKERPTRGIN